MISLGPVALLLATGCCESESETGTSRAREIDQRDSLGRPRTQKTTEKRLSRASHSSSMRMSLLGALLAAAIAFSPGTQSAWAATRATVGRTRRSQRPPLLAREGGLVGERFSALTPNASAAYSWSVSRLSKSQDSARDAYSWSVEVYSNASAVASAAVGRAVDGLRVSQFPALLPGWLTSRVQRRSADSSEPDESSDPQDEAEPPRRQLEALMGTSSGLYPIALCVAFALEVIGPCALVICVRAAAIRRPLIRRQHGLLAVWLVVEAVFYLSCCLIAARQNLRPGSLGEPPFGRARTPEWRRKVWRRVLRDPSQSPRDFVEGW